MPFVTVDQVVRFRKRAMEIEKERDELIIINNSLFKWSLFRFIPKQFWGIKKK